MAQPYRLPRPDLRGIMGAGLLALLPTQGLSAVPLAGYDLPMPPVLTGAQKVVPLCFRPSWTGTEAALIAQAAADPSVLVDDGARLKSALMAAMALGHPIHIPPTFVNSPIDITAGNPLNLRAVRLVVTGDSCVVGGPGLTASLLTVRNSSTQGANAKASLDFYCYGWRSNMQFAPRGPSTTTDHIYVTGFRRKIFDGGECYNGPHYAVAGGDSGIFATGPDVSVCNWHFVGCPDLGLYLSGPSDGASINMNAILVGNTYINCSTAWSAKRNFRNITSSGEIARGCRNGMACYEATGTGLGLKAGWTVNITGAVFEDMVSTCIDPRGSKNIKADFVVTGTFGLDRSNSYLDNGEPDVVLTNAGIIDMQDSYRCRFDFTVDVESTGPAHAAVRNRGNSAYNVVNATIKGIATGVSETSGDNNTFRFKLDPSVTSPGSTVGAGTELTWDYGGLPETRIGGIDRTPGRIPFRPNLNTASSAIVTLNVVHRYQTSGSNINCRLPDTAPDGAIVGVQKVDSSTGGQVRVCDSTATIVWGRIVNPGEIMFFIFNNIENVWEIFSKPPINGIYTTMLWGDPNAVPVSPEASSFFFDVGDQRPKIKDAAGVVRTILAGVDAADQRAVLGVENARQNFTPVGGGEVITIAPSTQKIIEVYFNNLSAVTTLTINFPTPVDGQRVLLLWLGDASSITLAAPVGTIRNGFTSITAGARTGWVYNAVTSFWHRVT